MTKYYVDANGKYIGGFDGAAPPVGAVEVPSAPASASDVWNGDGWTLVAVVPEEVTRRQGIQALLLEGVTEAMVEAKIIELITDPLQQALALAEFRTSTVFQRYRPLVVQIGPALGLDLNAVFTVAASLT